MNDSLDTPGMRLVTILASDPNPGRVDRSRMGRPNPADTEPRPVTSAEDVAATRAELAELRRRRACPPRPPKVDVTEDLIAAMEEVVRIMTGEMPASRVHTVEDIAAMAARLAARKAAAR